jgi:hypothetical protein
MVPHKERTFQGLIKISTHYFNKESSGFIEPFLNNPNSKIMIPIIPPINSAI